MHSPCIHCMVEGSASETQKALWPKTQKALWPKTQKALLPKHKNNSLIKNTTNTYGEFLSPKCIFKMSETFVKSIVKLVGSCAKPKRNQWPKVIGNPHFPNWGVNSPSDSEADVLKCWGVGAWLCTCCHDVRSGMVWSWLPNNANTNCWCKWGLHHQQKPDNR